jgi:subtilisin family serine protease
MKKMLVLIVLASVLAFGSALTVPASAQPVGVDSRGQGADKIAPELQATLDNLGSRDVMTAIVTMRDQADLTQMPGAARAARQQGVIRALQAHAEASQAQIRAFLRSREVQGLVSEFVPFWVFNGLSVTAAPDVFAELAARDDVAKITPDAIQVEPVPLLADSSVETNLSLVNAPALWSLGYHGEGIVVANMDSGVDIGSPSSPTELAAHWRGGNNSWYDPYGQHPTTPTDLSGHGTWTMGVMVAGDASGTAIGVAPGALWIAVKIFDDRGRSTATAIHKGYQWLMDPDSNPATADAPAVVNNSWTSSYPGCSLDFELDLESLRAIGILPVFAAGNLGPNGSTSASPANNPAAFAVGATDNTDQIAAFSSRGPSACGESSTIYPEIVAPGVNIKTTDQYGLYSAETGTSLAAPHVAGGLALLLSAFPNLSADQQGTALMSAAADLGLAGADNTFGYGRLDLLAAYDWLAASGANATPTPTPAPPTPTPTPTATPSPTPTPAPTVHIGDLDGSSAAGKSGWTAAVTIEVHTSDEKLVSDAIVTGKWSGGYSGDGSCTTDGSGRCQVTSGAISKKSSNATFTILNVSVGGYTYQSSSNHDPDGDSDGATIKVAKS